MSNFEQRKIMRRMKKLKPESFKRITKPLAPDHPNSSNLLSLQEFVKKNSTIVNEMRMRNLIYRRAKNGSDMYLRKIGSLWYIDVPKFFEWMNRKSWETRRKKLKKEVELIE